MMINRYEVTGILISIALLGIALAAYRFDVFNGFFGSETTLNEQGAVVIASQEADAREAALHNAVGGTELSRLVIEDVTLGTGVRTVANGDTLIVDYVGTTEAGVQFDSSYVRGEPFEFTVGEGRVIEGWERGVIGMKVGGKRILVIPADMAYGARQVGPIPPNSPLVFSIELLEIK